jgi:ferredoxin-like protein FixX
MKVPKYTFRTTEYKYKIPVKRPVCPAKCTHTNAYGQTVRTTLRIHAGGSASCGTCRRVFHLHLKESGLCYWYTEDE